MIDLRNLNEMELDVLKEFGNIGAGHAATSLSQLLDKEVDMAVPEVRVGEIKKESTLLNDGNPTIYGNCDYIYFGEKGEKIRPVFSKKKKKKEPSD